VSHHRGFDLRQALGHTRLSKPPRDDERSEELLYRLVESDVIGAHTFTPRGSLGKG
jgi:hypothetical protein